MEELNRLVIKIPTRYGDTGYLWFVQEGKVEWTLISFGQEYELYREIGKRSAMAEVGLLQLHPIGRATMEEYLGICEMAIADSEPTERLYDFFNLEVTVNLQDFDSYRQKRLREVVDSFEFEEIGLDIYRAVNPKPEVFTLGGFAREHIKTEYIGAKLKQTILKETQILLF